MAITSGFFNSSNGDRVYDASFFAEYNTLINGNGIGETTDFPFSNTGLDMVSTIGAGKAFIEGYYITNDSDVNLTHNAADPSNDRIDRIVLRLDLNTAARSINIVVRDGTPDTQPQPPALVRNSTIWELSLYQVLVPAASGVIPIGNETDERADRTVCGQVFYQGFIDDALQQQNTNDISELNTRVGQLNSLTTTDKTSIVNAVNEVQSEITSNDGDISTINTNIGTINGNITTINNNIGTLSSLTTTAQSNLVAAINEVQSEVNTADNEIGTLTSLTTSTNTNLVAAINEVQGETNSAASLASTANGTANTASTNATTALNNIGNLPSLTTTAKTNLVAAINEVQSEVNTADNEIGTLSTLTTTNKSNLVSAVNEIDAKTDPLDQVNLNDIGRIAVQRTTRNVTLSNTIIDRNQIRLVTDRFTENLRINDNRPVSGNSGYGQRFTSSITSNMDVIRSFTFFIVGITSNANPLRVTVVDVTTGTTLHTQFIPGNQIIYGRNEIIFSPEVEVTRNRTIDVRLDQNGVVSGGYSIGVFGQNILSGSDHISTTNLWATQSVSTVRDTAFSLRYFSNTTSGTVTQVTDIENVRNWVNLKVSAQNIGSGVSSTVTVRDETGTTTLASRTLINGDNYIDLSSINAQTHKRLNILYTLNRTSISLNEPIIDIGGVTCECPPLNLGIYELVEDVILQNDVASYTITIDPFEYSNLKIFVRNIRSTSTSTSSDFRMSLQPSSATHNYRYMRIASSSLIGLTNQTTFLLGQNVVAQRDLTDSDNGGFVKMDISLENSSVRWYATGVEEDSYLGIGMLRNKSQRDQRIIQFTPGANSILRGTMFTVWGIRRDDRV